MSDYVADYDFELPAALIADAPPERRDGGRLLVLGAGRALHDRDIVDLPELVREGDLWLINDTEVIPARLFARKPSGGRVEILLLEPLNDRRWRAWAKSNRPLREGMVLDVAEDFSLRMVRRDGRAWELELEVEDVDCALERHGHVPLPPYIARPDTRLDAERYQTVFARKRGAVAAPTAGLHLTEPLMVRMRRAGAEFATVTLHVGPGTFQPVTCARLDQHEMHEERFVIDDATAVRIEAARSEGRRVVCVGTTALRTVESAWRNGCVRAGTGRSRLFIRPGYRWKVADALLTNFHLPRSTLLMLVCAMAGMERTMNAYRHAIAEGYRFYSYGDAMFIDRACC